MSALPPIPPASASPPLTWRDANQRYLGAAIAVVKEQLTAPAAGRPSVPSAEVLAELARAEQLLPSPAALQTLCARFSLSSFERGVLLLCAGCELNGHFAESCSAAQKDPQAASVSFALAFSVLPDAHWSALSPEAPLRRWRLVEFEGPGLIINRPLRIDERILHHLTGTSYLDEWLRPILRPLKPCGTLPPSQRALVEQGITAVQHARNSQPLLIQLYGSDEQAQQDVAAALGEGLGLRIFTLKDLDLPSTPGEREELVLRWQREVVLSACALLILSSSSEQKIATLALCEHLSGLVILASPEPLPMSRPPLLRLEVKLPDAREQRALWHEVLGEKAPPDEATLDMLSAHFQLSSAEILSAGMAAYARLQARQGDGAEIPIAETLWESCRVQARTRLDDLAKRIQPVACWEDLVLPEPQRDLLHQLAEQVHRRAQVYEQWGFSGKGRRGLGISALFAGNSGTGKTLAAEVLANELRLDLYHIDLSQIVSKYIGETEKNLRRIFDAAEAGGAVLLFDEADALFGKRTETKDSHDRYANIEVSYLLQRMEAYRGLAILTTNIKSALDTAFLRRLRFIVQFPFPDSEQRQEIWQRAFPANTPTEGLSHKKLARLSVAGGHIRNIALHAAFLAAAAHEPVRMRHVLHAARCEYAKLEKPLTEAEIGGWV